MFSSSNTANPFFHLPSSFYSPPLPLFTNNTSHGSHIFQQDPVVGRFLPATNVPISDSVISMAENGSLPTFLPKKKPAVTKKDRHSKICTTHGLRDRRVRLSIGIARQFFDLQDMLGFEKGSQTLDWLFRMSRKAIKKLAETKHSCNGGATAKTLSSASDCQRESGAGQEVNNGGADGLEKSLVGVGKSEKMKKSEFQLLAKELRAKARARARERTVEKLSKKCSHPFGESTEIKRKLRPFSSVLDHEQNPDPAISRDSSSNNNSIITTNNNNFPNLPQNWDVNRFCAITNLNLSTALQIYGNPWEAYND